MEQNKQQDSENKKLGLGLLLLCFVFPLVGLLLFLAWKNTKPVKSRGACMASVFGFIVIVALNIIYNLLL